MYAGPCTASATTHRIRAAGLKRQCQGVFPMSRRVPRVLATFELSSTKTFTRSKRLCRSSAGGARAVPCSVDRPGTCALSAANARPPASCPRQAARTRPLSLAMATEASVATSQSSEHEKWNGAATRCDDGASP